MKDTKEENLKSIKVSDLKKLKKDLNLQKTLEISGLATSGKRNSSKVKYIKRKIARIETEISAKVFKEAVLRFGE